jgi:hypothetical protein
VEKESSTRKLLDIFQLSEAKGRSVRELRTLVQKGVIPYLRLGHRTHLFDLKRVDEALQRFEVKAVGEK